MTPPPPADGDLDLYVVNANQANKLYRNDGDGTFSDVSSSAGIADSGSGSGVAWGDYDADGDPDLLVVTSGGTNYLYKNDMDNGGICSTVPRATTALPAQNSGVSTRPM